MGGLTDGLDGRRAPSWDSGPRPRPPERGRTVGRYELLEELGRGGAGIVHLARQTDLERLVALKQLPAPRDGDTELVQRFLREARLAGALSHRNIVAVYEYLEHEGSAYIAMELLPHGSLRGYVGRLDLAQVGGVLEDVLAALDYASTRLVHRDVKPENVLVGADGRVKLADFGIARALDGPAANAQLTITGAVIGSPAYMAPEQAAGGAVGPWTDIYSAGVVAYELLVGERPHPPASSAAEALVRLVSAAIRPPREVSPSLDPGLATWLERMLQRDPADRHASAARAWDELDDHLVRLLGERWRRGAALPVTALPELPSAAWSQPDTSPTVAAEGTTIRPLCNLVALAAPLAVIAALLAAVVAGFFAG